MGLFDIFKSGKKVETDGNGLPPAKHERRYNARYQVNSPELLRIRIPSHGFFRIIDLSYRGCLIEPEGNSSFENQSVPFDFELQASVTELRFQASKIHRRDGRWALEFNHLSEESLRSLSMLIEPIRCGNSAIAVDSGIADKVGAGEVRRRFIGDGPLDVILEEKLPGNILFLMVTLRRGAEYSSVIWKDGQVITKKSLDVMGESARMAQTAEVDRQLVWSCTMACVGMKFSQGVFAAKLLHDWLTSTESGVRNKAV